MKEQTVEQEPQEPNIVTTKDEIQDELWRRGILSWLLYDYQHMVYDALMTAISAGKLTYVLNCSRRFGKTSILMLIALEHALQKPNQHIRFASSTAKELRNAVHPIVQIFLDTCPKDIKPKWNGTDGSYKFPNGSEIHIAGVNNQHEDDLRGSNSHLNIVDEAGTIDNLKYLVQSVLIPQTLTTDAITILASTPAVSSDHDYKIYYDKAEVQGTLSEFDIYDNTSLSPEKIKQIEEDNGGANSTDFQREYLCKWVVDENLDIIREWDDKYIGEEEKDEYYDFYHGYTVMDLGVKDKTAIIYGYYDFQQAKLIIQAEDIINGHDMTTEIVSELVINKEKGLWGARKPYKRIADNNNPLMLQDLNLVYGIHFNGTNKDNLDTMINKVRMFIGAGRLVVHPDCKELIGCLRYAIWNQRGNSANRQFGRSAAYGHYDALASLVYLIRNLDQNTNPIPTMYNVDINNTYTNKSAVAEHNTNVAAFKNALNRG